jgi:hypothetical protein
MLSWLSYFSMDSRLRGNDGSKANSNIAPLIGSVQSAHS